MRGPHYTTYFRYFSIVFRKLQTLLLYSINCTCYQCDFLRSICDDNDCNKCGQTSRPDVGTTIQTGGNFEESLGSCCFSLDLSYLNFHHIIFQGGCRCDRHFHRCDIVYHNLADLLLPLNIFHTWSTTSSSGIPCPPRRSKRRKD